MYGVNFRRRQEWRQCKFGYEERTRESFINEAREFNYSIFLNSNLDFMSPFIRTPPRSNYTEKKLNKKQSRRDSFISLEMRKEGTGRAIFIISL